MAGSSFLNRISPPATIVDDLDDFTCSICLEIFLTPVEICCGHIFCKDCLSPFQNIAEPTCPKCRKLFNLSTAKSAAIMSETLSTSATICPHCSKKVKLNKFRSHSISCEKKTQTIPDFSPVAETSQPIPQNIPNRHTFECPYCGLGNLDSRGLVAHCTEEHKRSHSRVVCPICASMPWGNPHQRSADLISHLNLRHRFEYDTLVDFNVTEDDALKRALAASLTEK